MFSTAQHGTSTSSKSIIANLINNLNPDVKNSEQTRETDKGVELYSEDNSPLNTNDDEKLIGKALYTINKEAKRIRDVRENLKEFLFEHEDLNETTLEYLRTKYPNITFDPEKGAVYVDENDGTYNKDELYDYIWELKGETDVLHDEIEEAKENNEDTTELEDEYEFNKSDLDYLENEYEKLNDVNFHELLKWTNLGEDYTKVRSVLDNIRDEALNVGMNIGFIDEYFPRKIINASAILDEYSKSTYLKKMLHDVDPNNVLSPEDKIEKLNIALKGYNGAITASSSFIKARHKLPIKSIAFLQLTSFKKTILVLLLLYEKDNLEYFCCLISYYRNYW